jgi:TonB family protein
MTMSQTLDLQDHREPYQGAFLAAVALHVAVVLAVVLPQWLAGTSQPFGDPNAGGAIGIQAVDKIPLAHRGAANPVANDTQSEVPQERPDTKRAAEVEKVSPEAVALPGRKPKRTADRASEPHRFVPYSQLVENQLTAKSAPSVSNPMFSDAPGAGQVGTGMSTTLGSRFAAYAQQIREIVARNWRTTDVDSRLQNAPVVILTFDLMRDGSVQNPRLLQRSGNPTLDFSVIRAIQDSVFPPIPPGFEKSSAKVEFTFELKR